jgi:hypothetical protein
MTKTKLPKGATAAPVIVSSDKTQLSQFSGDKSAWPVYLSVGTISKAIRQEVSARATVLVGYIPVPKLANVSPAKRSDQEAQIFHDCMRILLEPLVEAGKSGVDMLCADGFIRHVYPILAAYVADYPEQCLVTCCRDKRCPKCTVSYAHLGEPRKSPDRDPSATIDSIYNKARGRPCPGFDSQGLRCINPFWKDLPHCDIFECIMPDILHQLHKGVFKDHVVKWATSCVNGGAKEVDRRFICLPHHSDLRHFSNGISGVSQWTGREQKAMEKVFVGLLVGAVDPAVLQCVTAVVDFIYHAHLDEPTDRTLAQLESNWKSFHSSKWSAFGHIRKHFNIPKIHSMWHYIPSIRSRGSAGQFSTETSERLHIDYAKLAYRASSRKAYVRQMTRWLRRQEAVEKFAAYLQWAVPNYRAETRLDTTLGQQEDGEAGDEDEANDEPVPLASFAQSLRSDTSLRAEFSKHGSSALNATTEGEDDDTTDVGIDPTRLVRHLVAKRPGYGHVKVCTLMEDFAAPAFCTAWSKFMRDRLPHLGQFHDISVHSRIPVYKQFKISIPPLHQVSKSPLVDIIRARPGRPRAGLTQAVPSQFDTVLAFERAPIEPVPTSGFGG